MELTELLLPYLSDIGKIIMLSLKIFSFSNEYEKQLLKTIRELNLDLAKLKIMAHNFIDKFEEIDSAKKLIKCHL
jgi:hypothetical protein